MNDQAWVAWDAGDPARAIKRWSESVALLRELGERAFLGSFLMVLAWGQHRVADLATARRNALEGARITATLARFRI